VGNVSLLLSTAEDLAKFVEELKKESDRGLPLVAAAFVDDLLKETLRAFCCEGAPSSKLLDGANAPLGSFSSRTNACLALGLIDQFEYNEITLLRKVRNEFAHTKHGMSFKSSRVQGLCASLKSDLPQEAGYPLNEPRFRFINAAVIIVLRLYHRPDWVALERRKPKSWVSKEDTQWRSFQEDPPTSGAPIMVIGHKAQD
jgi:mannitol operon repressor